MAVSVIDSGHTFSRRDFIKAGAVTASLTLQPHLVAQSTNPIPDIWAEVTEAARQCYIQAYSSDISVPNHHFQGLGYINPQVFLTLATAIQDLGARADSLGVTETLASTLPYAPPDLAALSGKNLTWVANQAQCTLPSDFFTQLSLKVISSKVGIPLVRPSYYDATRFRLDVTSAVSQLQQFAAGNFSSLIARRNDTPRLVYVGFQSNDSGKNTLVGVGTAFSGLGLALVDKAGGVGVLTGSIIPAGGTAATVAAWTGVGLFVIGISLLGYVTYRVLTQEDHSRTPWTQQAPVNRDVPMPRPPSPSNRTTVPIWPPLQPARAPERDGWTETMELIG